MVGKIEASFPTSNWLRDALSAIVLVLIGIPVSIGIAQAYGVPPYAGLIAGIIGGVVVGWLSGSHTSVSGPSAGLSAIILAEMAQLRTLETFFLALFLAGLLQVVLGYLRVGALSYFFPSSVVKGLIAAVGLVLIFKQIPHLLGHDTDPIGEMSFWQPDRETTFTEFFKISGDTHLGAVLTSVVSLVLLFGWNRLPWRLLKVIPAPLVCIVAGVLLANWLRQFDKGWSVEPHHFFEVPLIAPDTPLLSILRFPDWSQWMNPMVYVAAFIVASVASLETLLNIEAIDRLDPEQRISPTSRELMAQGVGNALCGLLGGLPITSRVIHGTVNVQSGGKTRWAAILHGVLFAVLIFAVPTYINQIPIACIAAILFATGVRMARPMLFSDMWKQGFYQFVPFAITVLAIFFTEKLIGAVIGVMVGIGFILNSNLRRPLRKRIERHLSGEVIRVELSNQVSFLNRATLERTFEEASAGAHFLLDASNTDYIDPDVLALIRDFKTKTAPKRGIEVSLRGFKDKYSLVDETKYVDYSTRELQSNLSPFQVLQILREGNERFRTGASIFRDPQAQLKTADEGQFPFAAVLSCIDSRAPVETILDLGLGDIFSIRIAGNVVGPKVLGSLEYACGVAGSKLVLVLGHTKCGAVNASVKFFSEGVRPADATGCTYLEAIVDRITSSIEPHRGREFMQLVPEEKAAFVEQVSRANVLHSIEQIVRESPTLHSLAESGKVGFIGAMYNVGTGEIEFFEKESLGFQSPATS